MKTLHAPDTAAAFFDVAAAFTAALGPGAVILAAVVACAVLATLATKYLG